jgi:hypothetical protein
MNEPTSVTAKTLMDIGYALVNKPLVETIILLCVLSLLLFLIITSTSFVLSRIKGDMKVSLFSFLKIGKGKDKDDKKEDTGSKDISITINNSSSSELVRKENKVLTELGNEPYKVEELEEETSDKCSDNDTLVIISKSVRFGSEIAKYKELYLIKAQMSCAETRTDIIEGLLIKDYMELVYKRKGTATNIQDDSSFRIFSEMIHHHSHRNTLSVLRRLFKDNHLVQYTDEKYSEYMNVQCERMMVNMRLSVNNSIPSFLDPGREAINDIITNNSRVIIETFTEIMLEARSLAYKTEMLVKRKEREFDEEIIRLTGIHSAHTRADIQNADPFGAETNQ